MNNNIVLLIEKCKTDKRLYKELSKLVEIEESEVFYFINQFTLFQMISKDTNTNYVNYFNKVDILVIELSEKHKKDTFYKCLTTFVKFYSKGNIFHCLFTCDSHCEIYISFFQSFPYMNTFNEY